MWLMYDRGYKVNNALVLLIEFVKNVLIKMHFQASRLYLTPGTVHCWLGVEDSSRRSMLHERSVGCGK